MRPPSSWPAAPRSGTIDTTEQGYRRQRGKLLFALWCRLGGCYRFEAMLVLLFLVVNKIFLSEWNLGLF